MSGAPHLSIGEVLAELQDEFPDITISKIRFLESQGLIDPERTPSGYRKFHDADLARLRWILHEQKENFLPLKVIKERLDQLGPGEVLLIDEPEAGGREQESVEVHVEEQEVMPAPRPKRPSSRQPAFVPTLPAEEAGSEDVTTSTDQTYTRGELAAAARLEPAQVDELGSFGLLVPALEVAGEPRYDDAALDVARAAGGFFARGVEARHLRMYLTFAEREAVLFGQVLLPYVRQRNPDARARLQEELVELATLGRQLRGALLREAVRESLTE